MLSIKYHVCIGINLQLVIIPSTIHSILLNLWALIVATILLCTYQMTLLPLMGSLTPIGCYVSLFSTFGPPFGA